MDPVFRSSNVADDDAHELLSEYFTERTLGFDPTAGGYRTVLPDPANFVPPAGLFLVVLDEHEDPVGCGGIRMLDPRRAEVKHLYLRDAARGRGWGRLLLAELEQRAIEFGATEVVLDTNASLTVAGALYRRSGYTEIAPYNENPNATLWFCKVLTAE
ncbi:GNAT family N-acetyltransferase [Homoserinibacter sp. GY 40078]|uniref:GNAT family N-acetyltransferase n=1 Tax=Homoserinibacter sp. GY 40078 TaxID=2603275 RepID=UPI0011C8B658|nr:GNAT family N-acetyltransferase [Homoserinibacter sp. GY 40078]TXK19819.1 GNAT family N-acetyltransferase [Homoserinibacter sp. GY 40078]